MRQVHVVEAETQDGHIVVSTVDGLERFELEIDHALRAAVTEVRSVPSTDAAPSTEARITPREIQIRIRSGEDPAALAEACGSGLDWVLRFAGPVLAERDRVAHEARRAKARRRSADTTDEGQIVVFGEAVDERFAAYGIEADDVRWDAHRREDNQWVITARWVGGQSEHDAEWIFHLASRMVTPADDTAADLLSDRPVRSVLPPKEQTPAVRVAPPLMPGVVAFPVMSDTDTGPLPGAHEVLDDDAPSEPDQADPPDLDPSAINDPDDSLLPMEVPDAPEVTSKIPKVTAFAGGRRQRPQRESDEERTARATVPKWDDILLGVRRKRD